jgi:hypothetical protein
MRLGVTHDFDRCAINIFTCSAVGGVKPFIPTRLISILLSEFRSFNAFFGVFDRYFLPCVWSSRKTVSKWYQ